MSGTPRPHVNPCSEDGFTMLELVAAFALLLVGVLGTATMLDGASTATAKNKSREGATSLSREIVDVARSVRYDLLTDSSVVAELQTRPALQDSSPAPGYTIARRGITYTVAVTVCAMDDAKDGAGVHDVAVTFCPESAPPGTADRNPDDYRRVEVELSWNARGRTERNTQTTLLTNPAGGLGPTVSSVTMTLPVVADPANPVITSSAASATFDIDLASSGDAVSWSVDGDVQGNATGTGSDWTATWSLSGWEDGSYTVQAQGFDGEGRSGAAKKIPVVLNRNVPAAPTGFNGGRNGTGSHVDLEWLAAPEGDVVGHRVYRTDASGSVIARACPPVAAGADAYETTTECVDQAAPASAPLHYKAVAVDVSPTGVLREGTPTAVKQIVEGNTVPTIPINLVACAGGSIGCTLPDGSDAPVGTTVITWALSADLDLGDSVASYRIYRNGTGYAERYGRVYPTGAPVMKFVDTTPAGGPHTYRVTAVDTRYGESPKSLPVSG